MNRRSFLSAAALAPIVAMLSNLTKAKTAYAFDIEPGVLGSVALPMQPATFVGKYVDPGEWTGNPAYALRSYCNAAGYDVDEQSFDAAAAYCDELVPVEHEDEMAGG